MVNQNLIESWLAVMMIPGMTTAQAIRDLNDELGTLYTAQDFGKFRRGSRPIPQPMQDYMLRCAIGYAIGQSGVSIDDDLLDGIVDRLVPPKRR
ncbi:hypothetical protein SFMTTN_2089 [Sulfuriferula multivorans]|uniref:Uncharacterized protein n=1 Tax=Sulfuriferula multivorans TaxID=1559896 RepID=A0A401JF87_9PROT|nr:hypothetical protein [Sulfuriferula multivorans]GBL46276.1 hypothetical protein SFMTTN_2089 [Sulfuriferula multivorans]